MTPEDGIVRIVFHARPTPGSFLEMLRPYRGLRNDVLEDVMNAMRASSSKLAQAELGRDLVCSLWAISHLGRTWALASDGMLQRNGLITDADVTTLRAFLDRFDDEVLILLHGTEGNEGFDERT